MASLSYEELHRAVSGGGVGMRWRTRLQPLGGPGDKVFPPTYDTNERSETQYAIETRHHDGKDVEAVVLDSVASQANRFELSLLDAYRAGELSLPLASVNFEGTAAADLGRISSLEASHRIFDALFRDSLLGGVPFRRSSEGQAITDASTRNAAALYHHCPTALVFGGWDSTGPRGGRGAKYERSLSSEIVGLGAVRGVKTASRIDPAGIELKAGPLYEARDQSLGDWTLEEAKATKEKGKPKPYARSKGERPGRPSQANFGNVTPSINARAGGVTVDAILATTVLSFIQLRRLHFPLDHTGTPLPEQTRDAAEAAARTALAALGMAAVTLAFDEGFDLRSRCVLVPESNPALELITRGGGKPIAVELDRSAALALLAESVERAAEAGLTWAEEELLLTPSPQLVELIRRSHELAARGEAEEDGGS